MSTCRMTGECTRARRWRVVSNLDELAEEILSSACLDARSQLAEFLVGWKSTDKTVSWLPKTSRISFSGPQTGRTRPIKE